MTLTLEELQKENDTLRGICAYENIDCLYCGLPRAEMARCHHGFPGCPRADDMMGAPARIQEKYGPVRKEGANGTA
jgi:hypothetical protein